METAPPRPEAHAHGNGSDHGESRTWSPRRTIGAPTPSKNSEEHSMTPRRYLFAVVDAGGNVPPELTAARRLVEGGHAVTVIADDSIAADVRATGAALRRWVHAPNRPDRRPEHDPARDWECRYPWE